MIKFEELGLSEPVLRAVTAEGYTTPTPIQAKSIPVVLHGNDILGCAQTGTGKTAAFALPILTLLSTRKAPVDPQSVDPQNSGQRLPSGPTGNVNAMPRGRFGSRGKEPRPQIQTGRGPSRKIRALILSPTRELAGQIGDSFRAYGKFTDLRYTMIFGGVNQNPQTRALRDGIDILVATPGRLLDLMNQGFVDLSHIEIFVLDEADRMLDMGFIPDIRRIMQHVPTKRQTLFFSATMPEDIKRLAGAILRNPVSVTIEPEAPAAQRIDQTVYFLDKRAKSSALIHLLGSLPVTRAIVFTRTKHGADHVSRHLRDAGIDSEVIHGNKTQRHRQNALHNFKTGKSHILLATDIAARGIDVDGVSHVFNFDIPDVAETYVHRIGRTARAGASGIAIAFCDAEERGNLRDIERLTRVPIRISDDLPEALKRQTPRSMQPRRAPQGPSGFVPGISGNSGAGKVGPAAPGEPHTHPHTPHSGGPNAGRSGHQKTNHKPYGPNANRGPRSGPHHTRSGPQQGGGGASRPRGK